MVILINSHKTELKIGLKIKLKMELKIELKLELKIAIAKFSVKNIWNTTVFLTNKMGVKRFTELGIHTLITR